MLLKDTSGIPLEQCYMLYLLLFFYVINFVMISNWIQSFQVKSSFYNMIKPGFLYNICIDFFIYKYVWINIFIIITFLRKGRFSPLSLMSKTYDVNKSTHDVSVLMVITQVFHAPNFLIFWSTWCSPACLYHFAIK